MYKRFYTFGTYGENNMRKNSFLAEVSFKSEKQIRWNNGIDFCKLFNFYC